MLPFLPSVALWWLPAIGEHRHLLLGALPANRSEPQAEHGAFALDGGANRSSIEPRFAGVVELCGQETGRRSPQRAAVACRQRSRRPGWVLTAVVQVLADREEPMRAKDIHTAVEALVGEPVAWSSIKVPSLTTPRAPRVGSYGWRGGGTCWRAVEWSKLGAISCMFTVAEAAFGVSASTPKVRAGERFVASADLARH